ncbi:hypothetical protein [Ignicoccus hospitalis]|uniref:Uncharacterized protein n=1 Tax=Ignicoccus hospitalis (strain KIN4/I / DSM 18386 / JCM 14125) TaxID=453591 RepID=A8A8P9_IGNH4|nr:hypothetical protein [Ignicoccus hospitalis]ABU81301.1 hypothetical protein Igni_0117 [Ignicoccus hospitalis KIN4/I]HIH90395.1 hypothetical protein [Desulfurococcaceae archaeon]
MDVSFILLNSVLFATTSYVGKYLKYLKASFLVPASSDFALAATILSLYFLGRADATFLIFATIPVAAALWKSRGRQILYLKAIAYTVTTLMIPYLSYEVYEYAQSLLTGFLFVDPNMLYLSVITVTLTSVLVAFRKNVIYSIFDPEFAALKNMRPALWIGLLVVTSIIDGFSLTLSLGFLLAHVVALSAVGVRETPKAAVIFFVTSLALSSVVAAPLACAASAVAVRAGEVLLLRLLSGREVRGLRATGLRKALPRLSRVP